MEDNFSEISYTDLLMDDSFIDHQLNPTERSTLYWNKWLSQKTDNEKQWKIAISIFADIKLGLQKYSQTAITEDTAHQLLRRIRETNSKIK